jgi:hypothetical protein
VLGDQLSKQAATTKVQLEKTERPGNSEEATTPAESVGTLKKWKSEKATAAAVHKTIRTLRKWRKLGRGPPYTFFGRTVMYDEDSLAEHFKQSEITPVRTKQRGHQR